MIFSENRYPLFGIMLLFQPQSDDPHEAVWDLNVAGQPVSVSDQDALVVEINDAFLVEDLLGDLLVDRLALNRLIGEPRFVEPGIDVLVAEISDVLRRLALVEDVGVAVRIDAAGPADLEDLEAPGLRLVERGRELGDAHLDLEA